MGLFVLIMLGIMLGTLGITSGIGKDRQSIYMLTGTAQGLTEDTKILLQGLEVGRVNQVNPVIDSTNGALSFVVELRIDRKFPDGTPLTLRRGTKAVVDQSTPIAPLVIRLEQGDETHAPPLAQGDTIRSSRRISLDFLAGAAQDLSNEVLTTLKESQKLINETSRVLASTNTILEKTSPRVLALLEQVSGQLERTDRVLQDIEPRVGPMQDSIMAVISDARRVIVRLDELANTANNMAVENRDEIRETIRRLRNSAIMLEHFTDQVSRRPLRFLTGVRPPKLESDTGK